VRLFRTVIFNTLKISKHLDFIFKTGGILLFCFAVAVSAAVYGAELSASEENDAGLTENMIKIGKGLSLHKQTYLLPLTWGSNDSGLEDAELKFQLSLKQKLFGSNFYAAYTQKSFWRLLDDKDSRPFRETNYNPEFFYRLLPENNPLGNWGSDFGYEHESNGSSEPKSRSWDRLYIRPYYEYQKFSTELKIWYRFREDVSEDDNPGIEDYYGYGELKIAYEFENNRMLSGIGRWNPNTGRSGLQFDYSFPLPGKDVFLFAQLWTGYGESLVDYNNCITSFGFGVMFKR